MITKYRIAARIDPRSGQTYYVAERRWLLFWWSSSVIGDLNWPQDITFPSRAMAAEALRKYHAQAFAIV